MFYVPASLLGIDPSFGSQLSIIPEISSSNKLGSPFEYRKNCGASRL